MAERAAWLLPRTGSDGQTREDTRLAQGVFMTPDTASTNRSGILPGASSGSVPFDLQAVSAMQCKITPGRAYIQGTTAQGAYPAVATADKTLTHSAGNATNPRIDLIYLKIYDHFIDSSGQTIATVEKLEGTPAASPVAPALPAASIALWEVRVNAGVSSGNGGINSNPGWTSARTDRRQYTVAAGGILPSSSGNGSYAGQYRDNAGVLERWSGAAWVPWPVVNWTSYTPTWTAASGGASVGNGSITGTYVKQGKLVHARVNLAFGSTTNSGSGVWSFSLPVAAASGTVGATGSVMGIDQTVNLYAGVALVQAAATTAQIYSGGSATAWGPSTPFTWGNNDSLVFTVTYESAT